MRRLITDLVLIIIVKIQYSTTLDFMNTGIVLMLR